MRTREGPETVSEAKAFAARSLTLGPKAGYWRALGPFAVMAPFAVFFAGLTTYDYVSTGFRPADGVIGAWILFGFFGAGAVVFLPGLLASRKDCTLGVDASGVRFVRGKKEQRIPWVEMTEVTWGPRRTRLGKTAAVGEAVRIRGSSELLPIDADEVTYRIDHSAWIETVALIADTARGHGAVVTSPSSPEW